jgi:hypothetical protein
MSYFYTEDDNRAITKKGAEPQSGTTKLPQKARRVTGFHPKIRVIL